jgi:hypothetical protein
LTLFREKGTRALLEELQLRGRLCLRDAETQSEYGQQAEEWSHSRFTVIGLASVNRSAGIV